MRRTFFVLLGVLVLSGCSWFGGDDDQPRLEGERVSILSLQKALTPDTSIDDLPFYVMPRQWHNKFWPQAGGYPNHVMQNLALDPDQPEKIWDVSIGSGSSAKLPLTSHPVVVNGRIFVLNTKAELVAINAHTGEKIWDVDVGALDEDDKVIAGGVSYSRGQLYVTNGYSEVLALDPNDGEIKWRKDIPAPSRAGPTVMDNRVFVTTLDNRILALDIKNGNILWDYAGISGVSALVGAASPAAANGVVVPVFSSGEIFALRVENGSVAWGENLASFRNAGGLSGIADIKGLPVIDKGIVYAVSFSGRFVAIDERTGNRIWERQIGGSQTPWIAGDWIFITTNENELVALHKTNGAIHWVEQLPRYEDEAARDGPIFWSGPIMAGDRLILASSHGRVLEINPGDGQTIREWETDRTIRLPLVVADKTIYMLAENGTLLAYK